MDYLLFIQYHLNNLNAKAKFKCLFFNYNLKIFYRIKGLILSVLACDVCSDFID